MIWVYEKTKKKRIEAVTSAPLSVRSFNRWLSGAEATKYYFTNTTGLVAEPAFDDKVI
jgi:3-deoxy-D-manno-octulosonic-acid transferase